MLPICKVLSILKIKALRAASHLSDGKSTCNCCCPCSDYDKSRTNARQAQHNMYATKVAYDLDYDYPHDDTSYSVGTDIMEIYANATHTINPGSTSPFIPREQWIQLTQEQRDAILDKRRKTTGSPPGGCVPSNQPT
jgi:hypothetical protein